MNSKSAIMIVVEGFSTSLLGCYGSPWCRTPNLDTFAASSVVFDDCWLQTDRLSSNYDALLTTDGDNWVNRAEQFGLESVLLTDQVNLSDVANIDSFSKVLTLDDLLVDGNSENVNATGEPRHRDENDPTQCRTPLFLEKSIEFWLNHDARSRPEIVWLHLSGWNGPWDAPIELRESLRDDEDPTVIESIRPPSIRVTSEEDLDCRIPWVQAAAAQMMILDQAWQYIDLAIQQVSASVDLAVVLASLGGCPLGEHGVIGCEQECIYAERMRVPLILRTTNEAPIGYRIPHVANLTDVGPALGNWLLNEQNNATPIDFLRRPVNSDGVVISSKTSKSLSIRAGAWCYIGSLDSDCVTAEENATEGNTASDSEDSDIGSVKSSHDESIARSNELESAVGKAPQLFLMPEDQWQQNNVAARAHETMSDIQQLKLKLQASSEQMRASELPDTIK